MRANILISAFLASFVTGSAIPADATLVERQNGNFQCLDATNGPYLDQVKRGLSNIAGSDQFCVSKSGACDRVSTYGTAGFQLCSVSRDGNPPACFDRTALIKYFSAITKQCPETEPGSIWSRVKGGYTLAANELPNGTLWAYVYLENAAST